MDAAMRTPHVEGDATPVDGAGSGSNVKRSIRALHESIGVRLSLPERSPEATLEDADAGEHKHQHDEEKGEAKLQQEQVSEEGFGETTYVSLTLDATPCFHSIEESNTVLICFDLLFPKG